MPKNHCLKFETAIYIKFKLITKTKRSVFADPKLQGDQEKK